MKRRTTFACVAALAISALLFTPSLSSARDPIPRGTATEGGEPISDTDYRCPSNAVHSPGEMGDDDGWGIGHAAKADVLHDDALAVVLYPERGNQPPAVPWQFLRFLILFYLLR